jgi:Thymidylate synthase
MMEYTLSPHMTGFEDFYRYLHGDLSSVEPVNRREWQTLDIAASAAHYTHERLNVSFRLRVPWQLGEAQEYTHPDLPWAEEHFLERVSGQALNPPPSFEKWPYHNGSPTAHMTASEDKFDHTYPERIWPRHARKTGADYSTRPAGMKGIRFPYGDLLDVIAMLNRNPLTRQAYLPIWFPEDTGATQGQRVPCSLGFHFQLNPETKALDVTYMIRSCDLVRHFRNDVYMAIRLLQWVCQETMDGDLKYLKPGDLVMHIMNLHMMVGDASKR